MRRALAALLSLLVASGEAFREENATVEARHASRDAKTKSQASHCVKAGCLKKNALRYFETWNLHDVSRLKDLFAAEATLRDWDVEVAGRDAVVAANAKIFAAVPGIKIEVLTTHVAVNTTTVVCEILVRTNEQREGRGAQGGRRHQLRRGEQNCVRAGIQGLTRCGRAHPTPRHVV